jgi:histidine triad (HIT) family protein
MDCIFCKIIKGEIPSTKVYEDDFVYAFDDISPAAPIHTLIIPKEHIVNVNDLSENNSSVMSHLFLAAKKVAEIKNISGDGYRIILNNEKGAGQEVLHMHLHVLGGKYPMGPMLQK